MAAGPSNIPASGSVRQKKCCSCNGKFAHCKSCACVKRLQPCSNCLPMKHGGCSDSSASLTIADTESSFSSVKSMASAPPSDTAPSPHSTAPPQPSMNSLSSSLPLPPPQPPRPPPQPPPPQRFISKGKPCIVQGCSECVAPTMWHVHMANHAKGLFGGEVPITWLQEHRLHICDVCSDLVAISQFPIHQRSCVANRLNNIGLETPLVDSQSQPVELPSFEDICSLRCPTMRFIPHRAKPSFARVLSSVLFDIILQNSVAAWKKLFMLPKCVLPTAKRAGRHNHPVSIELLCDLWSKGHLCQLWQRAMSRGSSPRSLVGSKKDLGLSGCVLGTRWFVW